MPKRLFDVIFSMLGLLACLPLFAATAILLKLDSRGPVFFKHQRIGRNFKPFALYKFRTMAADTSQKGLPITVEGDPRITTVGRFLRRTKIDELPQLWNVLRGDMSFVGPRPEVPRYVEMFNREYSAILKVKPGITDYAAIEFRDEESVLKKYGNPEEAYIKEVLPQKIKLYNRYLNEKSFFTDMKLIFLTLFAVSGKGKK